MAQSYNEYGDSDDFPTVESQKKAFLMAGMVLEGGFDVGISTNPDLKNRPNFIEINGEKVVCLAQGGECRQDGEFYFPGGLNNPKSWETPIVSPTCSNDCNYKYLVCEGHDHTDDDVRVFIVNPYRNKFSGQFSRFCKDFDRIKPLDQNTYHHRIDE